MAMASFKKKHYPRIQVELRSCGQRCWSLERDDARRANMKGKVIEHDII
jgi:hypothetical protein